MIKHIAIIGNRTSKSMDVLVRIASYISFGKLKIIMKSFTEPSYYYYYHFISLFRSFTEPSSYYCPFISLFHSRTAKMTKLNKPIKRSYIGSLRYIYSFKELLEKEKRFSVHRRNIQSLAIRIYKSESSETRIN